MLTKNQEKSPVKLRKRPQQQRSSETMAVIVKAAARILETKGFEGFNTNAIAQSAGVSIGSLYQYFPGKHALLSALIEREMEPLLRACTKLMHSSDFKGALRSYVRASVSNQMRRPELARLIDLAERREMFNDQVSSTASRLHSVMKSLLGLPDAPRVSRPEIAAADLVAITRALVDAAGERAERNLEQLTTQIEGAIFGYLGLRAV